MSPFSCVLVLVTAAAPSLAAPAPLDIVVPAQLTPAAEDEPVLLLNRSTRPLEVDLSVAPLRPAVPGAVVVVEPASVRLDGAGHRRVRIVAHGLKAGGRYEAYVTAILRSEGAVVRQAITLVVPADAKVAEALVLVTPEKLNVTVAPWRGRSADVVLALSPSAGLPVGPALADALASLRADLVTKDGHAATLVAEAAILRRTLEPSPSPDAVRFRIDGLGPPGVYEGKLGEVSVAVTRSRPLACAVALLLAGVGVALVVHRFVGVTSKVWSIEERADTLRARWAAVRKAVEKRSAAVRAFDMAATLEDALRRIEDDARALAAASLVLEDAKLIDRLNALEKAVSESWPQLGEAAAALAVAVKRAEAEANEKSRPRKPASAAVLDVARPVARGGEVAPSALPEKIESVRAMAKLVDDWCATNALARACDELLREAPGHDARRGELESAWYDLWTSRDLRNETPSTRKRLHELRKKLELAPPAKEAALRTPERAPAATASPAPEPVRATVLRRRAMTAAWAMLPLTLAVGLVAVLKPLYFGRPWGTPLDCVEAFAAGFGTQSGLTLVNTLLAQLLAVRASVRKLP